MDSRPVTELKGFALPEGLAAPCKAPSTLPEGPLSAGAVERAWAEDRSGLSECGAKHKATVDLYRSRDKGLSGDR